MILRVKICTIIKVLLVFSLIVMIAENAFSAKVIPLVKSYDKADYNAGRQNWDIAKDQNGIIYFANTDGLLSNTFGEWTLYPLEKGGTARSLHIKNDTIWVGGIDEFGFFYKNENCALIYRKIDDLDGEIIWQIVEHKNQMIFLAHSDLLIYNKATKKVERNSYNHQFWAIIEWDNELWAITTKGVVGTINNNTFHPNKLFTKQIPSEVRKVFIHNNHLVIISSDVIYLYDKKELSQVELKKELNNVKFFTGIPYNENTFLLGTVTEGLLSINYETGDYATISTSEGLLDNTVLALCKDEDDGIWLGLDYGIAKAEFKKNIYPIFNAGATYHIAQVDNRVYLSTNKGAFVSENQQKFQFINESTGQVWRIRTINNHLYMCHNEGVYSINKNNSLVPVYENSGVMDIARFGQTDYYLLSAYSGLLLVKYESSKFNLITNLYIWGNPKLYYDSKTNSIWGDTKKSPLMQFQLNNDSVQVKEHHKMERFFETPAGIVFYNGHKLNEYHPETGNFQEIQQSPYNLIHHREITALSVDKNLGAIAYVTKNEINLLVTLPDGTVHSYGNYISNINSDLVKSDPFLEIVNNELRIATDRGVIVFNMEYQSSPIQKAPVITSVNIGANGVYQKTNYPFKNNTIHLEKGRYNLQFQFTSPYSDTEFTEFRYKLEPYDKEWSEWESKVSKKEFTKISGGEYRFFLEARTNQTFVKQTILNINVSRKWFQNSWIVVPIIILFLLTFGYVAFLIVEVVKEKIQINRLAYEKRLKQEAVKSKNEQLMQYLEVISHKNSFLQEIKEIIARMRNAEAARCVNKIEEELNNEKNSFLYHKLFSENNQELIVRISKEYPSLTDNDIRILTLIRTNMSSKEIAAILNISNSSFDTSRYRIRKKLGLEHDENLSSFIRNY